MDCCGLYEYSYYNSYLNHVKAISNIPQDVKYWDHGSDGTVYDYTCGVTFL